VPSEVIRARKEMTASAFIHLIGMANTPEVRVDSGNTLCSTTAKWNGQTEAAVTNKNYLRAMDLDQVLKELQSMKSKFPSIDDLNSNVIHSILVSLQSDEISKISSIYLWGDKGRYEACTTSYQ
jgi:hypothetical protein